MPFQRIAPGWRPTVSALSLMEGRVYQIRFSNKLIVSGLLALGSLAMAVPLEAQQYLGTLTGQVKDTTGASVPNAQVSATDTVTHFTTKTVTNESGGYSIPFLTPDDYSLTITAKGFRSESRTGVTLTAGGNVNTDFALTVGSATESVEVTADVQLLDTGSANLATTFETAAVTDTPNIGRNPFVLATLAANVYSGNYMQGKASGFTNPFSGTAVQIDAAGSSGHNRLTLDGIPDDPAERLSGASYTGFVPSPEAVQEVKIQTALYDAQYGHGNGVVTNTVLRSGSNQYHGSAYFVFRDTYMDANTYERVPTQNATGTARTPRVNDTWTQPGFVIDGPLSIPHVYKGKDRTFFMVAYERIQLHQPLPYQGFVPTTTGTNPLTGATDGGEAGGDFSNLCSNFNASGVCVAGAGVQIYDPTSVTTPGANRTPFPYNIIPSSRINAAGAALLSYFPAPNSNFNSTTNYISSDTTEPNKYYSIVTRVDHSFSDRHKANATFFKDVLNQIEPNEGFPKNIGPSTTSYSSTNANAPGGDGYTVYRNNEGGSVDDVFAIKPTLVVDSRFGVIYHPFGLVYPGNVFDLSSIGINGSSLPFQSFPNTSSSDSYAGLAGGASGQISEDTLGSASLLVAKTLQRHSLRIGFDGNMSRYNVQNPQSGLGNFVFNRQFTQQNSSGLSGANCPTTNCTVGGDVNSGNAVAAMLLGVPSNGLYSNQIAYALQQIYYAFYAQDDWRVSDKLTVNMGLRWDYESPLSERYNRLNAGFCITCANPLQSSVTGLALNGGLTFVDTQSSPSRYSAPQKYANFQPRFGLAYQLAPTIVLRGGVGLIYFNTLESPLAQGYSNQTSYVATTNSVLPANFLSNPYPSGIQAPTGNSLGLATQLGQSVSYPDPNHVQPKMLQWSASLQFQLPAKMAVEIAYSGNKVSQLEINKQIDTLPASFFGTHASPLTTAQNAALNAQVTNPMAGLLPGSSLNAAKVSQYLLDVPFPEFTGVTDDYLSSGSALYNSLTVSVNKQLGHGLDMQGNFTWAKIMDQNVYLNPQDANPVRYQDPIPNLRGNLFGTYHFTQFTNLPLYERLPLGGWSLQGALRAYDGPLVPAPGGGTGSQYGTSTTYTQIGSVRNSNPTYSNFFNTCYQTIVNGAPTNVVGPTACASSASSPAFVQNPQFTLATIGPYLNIRELVHPLLDLSLFKQFKIHDSLNFELRGEFFNVLNTPNFGAPGTTPGTASYGVVTKTQVNDPRLTQLTIRMNF